MTFLRSLHRRGRSGLLAAVALSGAMLGGAIPAALSAETLQDAIAAAYRQNPVLRQDRFRQKSRDEAYVQARSQYGPTLDITSRAVISNARLRERSSNSETGDLAARLRQPLYTGGRLRGSLAAARATGLSGGQTLRQTEADTIRDVIIVYASVRRDEQLLAVSRENVSVLRDQLRENRARRRVEDVTLTDVAQADARLAAAEYQLAAAESDLAVSRSQYLQVVGNNPGTLAPVPDLPGLPGTTDQAYAMAEASNPLLQAAKYFEQASSATVAARKGEFRPNVSISAEAGYTGPLSPFDRDNFQRNLTAGVTVTQPLFTSGLIRSRVRQAQNLNDADQAQIDEVRRRALQNVTAAWSNLAAARVALVSGRRQVESAQLAFAGMQREQRFGLRSTIEVLNAEQELQNAQTILLNNRYNEYVAQATLLAAVGRLEARYLTPDLPLYDPEAEFRKVRNSGRTPLEPVVQLIDRIGSPGLRRPLSADLTGENRPVPNENLTLPPDPGAAVRNAPLVPITQSTLVPASDRPELRMAPVDLPPRSTTGTRPPR